jgi:L-iditol 2-dehydrogenase
MKISQIIGPRTSQVVEVADPVPGNGQVLVKVVASGVCTSDLPVWRSGGGDRAPVLLGHEIVGEVVAGGRPSDGRPVNGWPRGWSPGDLVTGLGGQGFASLAVLDADRILPVPAGIDPALALGEPVADLAEALSRARSVAVGTDGCCAGGALGALPAGTTVAVVGLGFMGLGLVQLVRDQAPGLLIGVDPLPAARSRALDLGADLVFAPDEVPAEFRGAVDRAHDRRVDIVLEATGVTPGLKTAGALVRPYGTLCVVGYHHAGDAMMDMDLWYKAVTIVNGFCPDQPRLMRAMREALDLIARHRFSYAPLVTHRFGLDGADQAFALMDARADGFVKAVLIP